MKDKIKVLHCVTTMNRGGLETVIMNYYRNIDRNKFAFDFLVQREGPFDYTNEINEMGGKIYAVPAFNPFRIKEYNSGLDKFFKKHVNEYDIIHAHNNSFAMYALRAAKKNSFPICIAHSHIANTNFNLLRAPFVAYNKSKIKNMSNVRFACSREAGKWLFGDDDFTIIKNAIDMKKFAFNKSTREEYRKKYKIGSQTILIGHIGRFEKQKNHMFLIKLMKNIKENGIDAKLMLIGDGKLRAMIQNEIEKNGLEDDVLCVGNVGNPYDYLNAMDIFVFPSYYEGLGMAVIEAQVNGLTCLVSDSVVEECKVTPLVRFLSLNSEQINYWRDGITKDSNGSRVDYRNEIRDSGYDIRLEANKLEEIYSSLVLRYGHDGRTVK